MNCSEQLLMKTERAKDFSCGNTGFLKRVMSVRIRLEQRSAPV